jgi:CBS domain containing-hemolysin-like protein
MLAFIISLSVAMTVSFFASFFEATLLSLTPGQVADISRKDPRVGVIWNGFKTRIERPITVILVLNSLAYSVGATVAGSKFDIVFGEKWIPVFTILFAYVMLQFTEILPKTIGVRFNRRVAPKMARPLELMTKLFSPIVTFVNFVNRPFAASSVAKQNITLEEISALAGLARLTDVIGSHQEKLIKGAWGLSNIPVEEVMVPTKDITFLNASRTMAEALLTAHMDPHTRFPICDGGDTDKILGYVNFKEMVQWARTNPSDPSLKGIIRPVHFIPPDKPTAELLREFVEKHIHIAVVRSEDGKTLGLVTLEDILEELLGKLGDEFDHAPKMADALSGGTWMIGGGLSMQELVANLKVQLPDAVGNVSTWLIRRIGHLPKPNDIHKETGVEFMIRRVRRGNIFEVMVTPQKAGAE